MVKIKGVRCSRKLIRNITDAEYRDFMCMGLTDDLGRDCGCIRQDLRYLLRAEPRRPHQVFVARVDGGVQAWGLLRFRWNLEQPPFYQCYTEPRYRCNGLGSTLADMVKRHLGSDKVFHIPWDKTSSRFFESVGFVNTRYVNE